MRRTRAFSSPWRCCSPPRRRARSRPRCGQGRLPAALRPLRDLARRPLCPRPARRSSSASSAATRSARCSTRPLPAELIDGHGVAIRRMTSADRAAGCHLAFVQGAAPTDTSAAAAGAARPADPDRHRRPRRAAARHDPFHHRRRPRPLLHRRGRGRRARPFDQLAPARFGGRRQAAALMRRFARLSARWSNAPAGDRRDGRLAAARRHRHHPPERSRLSRPPGAGDAGPGRHPAASVTAALDFGDREAAQQAVDAIRVNRQIRAIGVYRDDGALIAGYGRDGAAPAAPLRRPAAGGRQCGHRDRAGDQPRRADRHRLSRRRSRAAVAPPDPLSRHRPAGGDGGSGRRRPRHRPERAAPRQPRARPSAPRRWSAPMPN